MNYLQDYIIKRKKVIRNGYDPGLVIKIEDKFGVKNINSILDAVRTDDFYMMIARGDLFNEVNYTKLAMVEQYLSNVCHKKNVGVMIGTGLLESMKSSKRPTRAEVCDVWDAMRHKPEYLMLSAETSNSKYPILAVNTIKNIVDNYKKMKGKLH